MDKSAEIIMLDGAEEHFIGFSQSGKSGVPVHGKPGFFGREYPNR